MNLFTLVQNVQKNMYWLNQGIAATIQLQVNALVVVKIPINAIYVKVKLNIMLQNKELAVI